MAFDALEPFGEEVASWRAGVIAAVVANVNRSAKKHPQPFQPVDFMLGLRAEEDKPVDLQDRIAGVMASFGGRARKGG